MSHAAHAPHASHPSHAPVPTLARQFRRTKSQLDRVVQWTLQPDTLLQIVRPSASAWSVATHLDHLNVANGILVSAIRDLLNNPNAPQDTVKDEARGFLGAGIFERRKFKAPEFVLPKGSTLNEIREDARAIVAGFAALEDRLDNPALAHATAPHPVLGPLTADLWMRFMETHTFHHLEIMCEIAGANL